MRSTCRLNLLFITALCLALCSSLTARLADGAARLLQNSSVSPDQSVKMAVTVPGKQLLCAVLTVAGPGKPSPKTAAWLLVFITAAIVLVESTNRRRLAAALRIVATILPQHPVFALRL